MEVLSKLHTVADFYIQMRNVDRSYAETCLDMHIEYLRGPKNRPTRDPSGLLKMCYDFISGFRRNPFYFIGTNQGLAVMTTASSHSPSATITHDGGESSNGHSAQLSRSSEESSSSSSRTPHLFGSHYSPLTTSERFSSQTYSSSADSSEVGETYAGIRPHTRLD